MNKISKILSLLTFILVVLLSTTCLATNQDITSSGDVQYIDNYEEYEQLINDTASDYSQEELKEYYAEYQQYIAEYYQNYNREETVKARVVEVNNVEERYEFNEYYYSVSKYEIQPIVVEVLEGEYIGQKFNIDYLLTGDSLNNVKYSALQKGDTIFVAMVMDEQTGEVYADITNAGSNVERFGIVVCIGIVAVLLVIIYGGKKGVLASLIALMVFDFCLVIIPNMGFAGQGFLIGSIAFTILLIVTISIIEQGNSIKALASIGISSLITLVAIVLLLTANYLTRTVGITFETAAVSENVLLGNMNFETLYIMITMIIASAFITNIVCKSITKIDQAEENGFNEKLAVCKDILGSNVIIVVVTLMALYIPNHLLLLTNKYTATEIWNAEILVSELLRVFVIVMVMALAIPTVVAIYRKEEKQ